MTPIASESMGVRSMCTRVKTPDVDILFDPSAALSMRYRLEPHPLEYQRLQDRLEAIFVAAREADIISVSHYHHDHVRPGFTDFRYLFSSKEELQRMFEGKVVFAKDNRDHINASQRRRGYFFERDISGLARSITWSDGTTHLFGDTRMTFSAPMPHGPDNTPLGYVVLTTIECGPDRFLFAPDVQGPVSSSTLDYILRVRPHLVVIGGPAIYLSGEQHLCDLALSSLKSIVSECPIVVVDHHLMRSSEAHQWLAQLRDVARDVGHSVMSMAELAGVSVQCFEAERRYLYESSPPSAEFMHWTQSSDEFKASHRPPIDG